MKNICVVISACLLLFAACSKDPDTDATPAAISFTAPQGWPQPVYYFQNNTLTREGFELGRRLFYDTRLSRDASTSCGSCHQPFAAFAQTDHSLSHGVNGLLGNRNSPGLFNLAWHPAFFWDGGVNHIESQPINPITNPVEMGETLDNIVAKISSDAAYRKRFSNVFGSEEVTTQRIFRALAQFMCTMVSDQSRYDSVSRGQAVFTAAEEAGQTIFTQHCATCHKAPLFSDFSYRNNGLKPGYDNDSGRGHITHAIEDIYRFKVPSLRNLKYTAPYMHDGRFTTLEQVLDHYTTGIHQSPTLDPLLQSGIQLSTEDRSNLLVFLNTLNDEVFVKDARFTEVH